MLSSCIAKSEASSVSLQSRKEIVKNPETTLVDVRIEEQFKESPIKNTVNIPLAEIEKNIDFFKSQKQTVLFCNSGRQSAAAMEILKKNGVTNVIDGKSWKNIQAIQNESN